MGAYLRNQLGMAVTVGGFDLMLVVPTGQVVRKATFKSNEILYIGVKEYISHNMLCIFESKSEFLDSLWGGLLSRQGGGGTLKRRYTTRTSS